MKTENDWLIKTLCLVGVLIVFFNFTGVVSAEVEGSGKDSIGFGDAVGILGMYAAVMMLLAVGPGFRYI